MEPKASVFIDGSKTCFAQKKMGKWLDWLKVWRFLKRQYETIEFWYYAGLRKKDIKAQKFLKKLRKIGLKIITKPVEFIIDKLGREIKKANFEVKITGNVLTRVKKFDMVLLFSGDSDLAYLIELLDKEKKKIYIFSLKKTLLWELKIKADRGFFIENFSYLTKGKNLLNFN